MSDLPKCLVVDDSVSVCHFLSDTLQQCGVTVADAITDPRIAVNSLYQKPNHYNIIFVDLHMAGIDGMELIKHLEAIKYRGAVVIISALEKRVIDYAATLVKKSSVRLLGTLIKPIQTESITFLLKRYSNCFESTKPVHREISKAELLNFLNRKHVVAYCQPQFERGSYAISGIECLVRLKTKTNKIIQPAQFVAVAEKYHLIDALLMSMLNYLLPKIVRLLDTGPISPTVSINLSPLQLFNENLPDIISMMLDKYSIEKSSIMLEITENHALIDDEQLKNLNRLRIHGFKLSLDDYGTGFTNLSQLKTMPFNEIKLDRQFIHGIATDDTLKSIVKSICELCHTLDMKVLAEGVERHRDLETLEELGIDAYQGFLFCRPKPITELINWSRIWKNNITPGLESITPTPLIDPTKTQSTNNLRPQ